MRAYEASALVLALAAAVVLTIPRASTTFDLHAQSETVVYRPEREQEWELPGVRVHSGLEDTAGTVVTGRLVLRPGVKVVIDRLSLGPLFIRFESPDPERILAEFHRHEGPALTLRAASQIVVPDVESRARLGEGLVLTLRGRLDVGRPPHESTETRAPILRSGTVSMLGSTVAGFGSFSAGSVTLYAGDQFEIEAPESASIGFIAADEQPALTVGYRTDAKFATIVRPGGSTPRIGASRLALLREDHVLQGFILALLFLIRPIEWGARSVTARIRAERGRRRRLTTAVLPVVAAFTLCPVPLGGQSVALEGAEKGQGLTHPRGEGECFVVAPHHVMGRDDASLARSGTLTGEGGAKAPATVRERFSRADLVVLEFSSNPAFPCPEWNIPENLGDLLLDTSAPAMLRRREEDGSVGFVPVWLRNVDAQFVTVVPRLAVDEVAQGMSGSQLIVKGVFAGILQEVLPDGSGRVMRSDYVQRIVSGFFVQRARPQQTPLVSDEVTITLTPGESRILSGRSIFGYDYPQTGVVVVKLNGVGHMIGPGDRLPFPDPRGDCFIAVIRWGMPTSANSRTEASFRVVCNPQ